MSRLVLTRHAETTAQVEGRYNGNTDVDITDRGRHQAHLLGAWAKSASLDAIWSSPLRRALDTAMPASETTGLVVNVDDRLKELAFGLAEGQTLKQLEEEFKAQVDAFQQAPVDHHLPEGENPRRAGQRVVECLKEIRAQHSNGRVLVVSHNTVLRLVLCELLGIALNEYRRRFPSVRNCSLTEVQFKNGSAALLQYNSPIEFLEAHQ